MTARPEKEERSGSATATGSRHYRAFVGPEKKYDLVAAMQFNLLTLLGLREEHFLLDIGCGSLRGGRLFIPFLRPGRYFGIEPEKWLIEEGIGNEIGRDLIEIKRPVFSNDSDFTLTVFDREFDFLLAQSVFSHAAPKQIERCLGEARAVMKGDSLFAATFVKGDRNYEGNEWVYPDCVAYTLGFIDGLAGRQGLACTPIDWPHPNNQTWVVFTDPSHAGKIPPLSDPVRCGKRLKKLERYLYVRLRTRVSAWLRSLKAGRRP